ncbi:MAG: hypothetical protein AB7G12_12640 [Thermoanaerobaculia bacterium]
MTMPYKVRTQLQAACGRFEISGQSAGDDRDSLVQMIQAAARFHDELAAALRTWDEEFPQEAVAEGPVPG